ncbi:head-tail joining protein [Paludisphaera rhizosphaerae]|uniref:head-tail joining protein n=1 Tax=Paludisphaera rhizosphaerae TaxID=2711216 RepID=UPI0013ED1AC3|nr:hypothetical protein [Paludisphaera rhizosphaerae]
MTAFAAALSALFADPNLGVDATFTPHAGGPSVPLRAVRVAERVDAGFALGQTGASAPALRFDAPRADLPARPTRGDVLHVGLESYKVTKAEPDEENLAWRLYVERGA